MQIVQEGDYFEVLGVAKTATTYEIGTRGRRPDVTWDLAFYHADISNELARTGIVIRQKAREAGQALSDATADTRITAAIKAKLVRDPDLSAWNISVSTADGVVTLSGTGTSTGNIGKAILLAMETDGVRQVISTLRVKR